MIEYVPSALAALVVVLNIMFFGVNVDRGRRRAAVANVVLAIIAVVVAIVWFPPEVFQ